MFKNSFDLLLLQYGFLADLRVYLSNGLTAGSHVGSSEQAAMVALVRGKFHHWK